jgi:hypothetical protein
MYWNHRVIRFVEKDTGDVFHKFAEVFYEDDGTLMGYHDPFMWSEDIAGMQELADHLLKATAQPVLEESDFEEVTLGND